MHGTGDRGHSELCTLMRCEGLGVASGSLCQMVYGQETWEGAGRVILARGHEG